MQLLARPTNCDHEIVLRKYMSYGKTCFSRVHVFQDDMFMSANVLRGVMFYRRKYLMGGHALV